MIVADTNVVAYLLIDGDRSEHARKALVLDPEWIAPAFWRSEFRNVLATYVRVGKMKIEFAVAIAAQAESLLASPASAAGSERVLRLAATSGCSAYDCEFVELAQSSGLRLLTEDRKILNAFPTTAVSLHDFIA